jgi:hypothetical protein
VKPDAAECDARDQLTHDGRLADPLHRLTKEATNQKQQPDLRDEECLRRPHVGLLAVRRQVRPGGGHNLRPINR